jgi:hypothetical protein
MRHAAVLALVSQGPPPIGTAARRTPAVHIEAVDAMLVPSATKGPCILCVVMDAFETMNVSLARALLVVAASDGPPWIATN